MIAPGAFWLVLLGGGGGNRTRVVINEIIRLRFDAVEML